MRCEICGKPDTGSNHKPCKHMGMVAPSLDDLIWIAPTATGPIGDERHVVSSLPVNGYIAYVRLDTMAKATENEKQAGAERRKRTSLGKY